MSAAGLRLVSGGSGSVDPDLESFDRWQENLRGLRANTIKVRHGVLMRLEDFLGKPLRDVTEGDLLRWEQAQVAGRKPETRRQYVASVKAFFRWAVLAEVIGADPSLRLTNPKLNRPLPRPIPEDQLRRAVEAAKPKMRLMILLGAFCGLRTQEIAGLYWTDLNTEVEPVTLLIREGKGGKERVVPVPRVVLEAFVAFGRRRSGPVFYGMEARQIDVKSVGRSINRHMESLGIHCTAHQLRHRYGTSAYRITKDLRLVQEMLGHSSPNTTARYAAYDQSGVVDMVEAMDAAWAEGAEQ